MSSAEREQKLVELLKDTYELSVNDAAHGEAIIQITEFNPASLADCNIGLGCISNIGEPDHSLVPQTIKEFALCVRMPEGDVKRLCIYRIPANTVEEAEQWFVDKFSCNLIKSLCYLELVKDDKPAGA